MNDITPLPWHRGSGGLYDSRGNLIAVRRSRWKTGSPDGQGDISREEADRNLEYIERAANALPELVEALRGLFKECAMVHKYWGENCNQKEANAAIKKARAALAKYQPKDSK